MDPATNSDPDGTGPHSGQHTTSKHTGITFMLPFLEDCVRWVGILIIYIPNWFHSPSQNQPIVGTFGGYLRRLRNKRNLKQICNFLLVKNYRDLSFGDGEGGFCSLTIVSSASMEDWSN